MPEQNDIEGQSRMDIVDDWLVVANTIEWTHQREGWRHCTCGEDGQSVKCGFCRLAEVDRALVRLIEWSVATVPSAEFDSLSPVNRMVLSWFHHHLDDLARLRGYPPSPLGVMRLLMELGASLDLEPCPGSPEPDDCSSEPVNRDGATEIKPAPDIPKYLFCPP